MRAIALVVLAGCASFEDPAIVLDMRVLGIETTPPEQILDIDPTRPPTIDEVLVQLQPIRVRALVAEPGRSGPLAWTMTACVLDEDSRCRADRIAFDFAGNVLPDPETSSMGNGCDGPEDGGTLCATLVPDHRLVQMLAQAIEDDQARGIGGIDLGISLRVTGIDVEPYADAFAVKHVRFAPRIPLDRVPNNNPHIEQLLFSTTGTGADAQRRRCNDGGPVDVVGYGQRVTLFPLAREGDKEPYVLPTLDGQAQYLVEYLSYQWIATHGSFTDERTGGPPDAFGNVPLDGTQWIAPDEDALVSIWVLQRDARYGVRWREACIKVGAGS